MFDGSESFMLIIAGCNRQVCLCAGIKPQHCLLANTPSQVALLQVTEPDARTASSLCVLCPHRCCSLQAGASLLICIARAQSSGTAFFVPGPSHGAAQHRRPGNESGMGAEDEESHAATCESGRS